MGRVKRGRRASAAMDILWLGWVGGLMVFCLVSISGQSTGSQSSDSLVDYSTSCGGNASLIADGVCDLSVNTAACDFDGGDCCECTCFVVDVPCNQTAAVYDCRDPDAPTDCRPTTETPTSSPTPSPTTSPASVLTYPACLGYVTRIKDGYCNEANNNADCGYDGGDCCSCTCVDDLEYPCGEQGGGFDCRDPGVALECASISTSCEGNADYIQDLYCDSSLNNLECSYDGGDCCICTCENVVASSSSSVPTGSVVSSSSSMFLCGDNGYDCLDPSVSAECALTVENPTPSPSGTSYSDCGGPTDNLGDGVCDEDTNSLACDWDGGDCCQCTCVDTEDNICEEFACLDPDASTDCETESSPGSDSSGCEDPESNVSDGQCNEATNTAVCGWDGGDCCECTCADSNFSCGEAGYSCLDPTQDCASSVNITSAATSASLSRAGVVGALFASVAAYCFLGGVISVTLAFLHRRCRKKAQSSPGGAVILPQTALMRARRKLSTSRLEET